MFIHVCNVCMYIFHFLLGSDSQSSSDTQSGDSSSKASTLPSVVRVMCVATFYEILLTCMMGGDLDGRVCSIVSNIKTHSQ